MSNLPVENMQISINTEFIKLDQLLKFSQIAESGADAKDIVLSEMVEVNGELCTMRGKKIHPGDSIMVYFEDAVVHLTVGEE